MEPELSLTVSTQKPLSKSLKYLLEKGVIFQHLPPEIVYITRGDTLKLQSDLPDVTASSYGRNYETFWDFSPSLTTTQEEAVRLIDSMNSSVESVDVRASLKENGTTLVLTNTTLNDSGVYHLRILGPLSTAAIHKDFNVIVEGINCILVHCIALNVHILTAGNGNVHMENHQTGNMLKEVKL